MAEQTGWQIPNLLIIAGTGNKSGKTTFACRLIEQVRHPGIVGVKITPHFHETTPGLVTVAETEGYSLYEETDSTATKDTSRMLRAGASRVYFAKVTDKSLPEAFLRIYNMLPPGIPVICESPALRLAAEPGVFVIMSSPDRNNVKNISYLRSFPHIGLTLDRLIQIENIPVAFEKGQWLIIPEE